jgi:L-amino acid N-acyltransferase YncA
MISDMMWQYDPDTAFIIRDATPEDAPALVNIYNHYVVHTPLTFEMIPISKSDMLDRIETITAAELPWLVFESKGQIHGYAYASPWKSRGAYQNTLESTIYLTPDSCAHGIGTYLYGTMLEHLASSDKHAVIAGIALPNPASIALHERLGFEKVAHFKQVGFKFEKWIDVGYWELLLQPRQIEA